MRLTDFLPRSTRPTGTGGAEIQSRIPGSGGSSLPEAAKWPTASFSGKRLDLSPRHGFRSLPTGGGMGMTLTAAGMRDWSACVRSM